VILAQCCRRLVAGEKSMFVLWSSFYLGGQFSIGS